MCQVRNTVNPKIEIEGLLRTLYDPCNVRLAEAPSHGVPVIVHDPRSTGAEQYTRIAAEMLGREKQASAA